MSKPPFIIPMRAGTQLWPRVIQLPATTTYSLEGMSDTAEGKAEALKAARRYCDQYDGKIKQFYLHWRRAVEVSNLTGLSKRQQIAPGIEASYTSNYGVEHLHIRVDANGLLKKQPQEEPPPPLLVSNGWVVEWAEGFADSESAIKIDNPKYLRINFEDALSCGGANNEIQKCIVTQQLTAVRGNWRIELIDYDGQVEWQDLGFDILRLSYTINGNNSKQLLDGDSRDLDRGCEMGDPEYTKYPENEHIFLHQGEQLEFSVIADTMDSRYHLGAYYELKFNWYPQVIA